MRGRIVPIRLKEDPELRRLRLQGAGLITSGVGASVIGGVLSGKALKRGARERQMAFEFGRPKGGMGGGLAGVMAGAEVFKKSVKTKRFTRRSAFVSKLIGGAVLGEGIRRIARSEGVEESAAFNIATEVSGQVAGLAVSAGIQKAARGQKISKTVKSALKKAAKFSIRSRLKF